MMDCRTCETTLVDLLYGELEPERARETREHLESCEGCRGSFEKLQDGLRLAEQLPLAEPPAQVTSHILELAAEHARGVRERQHAAAPGPLQRLLDLLTGGAMATQVKMALVTAVVAAAVLWIVPSRMDRAGKLDAGPVVTNYANGEAAPSQGVSPADRLELQVDMRRARIRAKGSAETPAPQLSASPVVEQGAELAEAPVGAPAVDAEEALLEGLLDLQPSDDRSDLGAVVSGDAPAKMKAKKDTDGFASREAKLETDGLPRSGGKPLREREVAADRPARAPAPAAAAAPEPSPFPAQPRRAASKRRSTGAQTDELMGNAYRPSAGGAARASTGSSNQSAAPASPRPKAARSAATDARALLERARTRAARNDRQGALADLAKVASTPSAGTLRAEALLRSARLSRQWQGCAAAHAAYGRLVSQHPASRQAGSGMLEHATCLQSLGRAAEARALLQRATRHPTVARQARAALNELPAANAAAAPAAVEAEPPRPAADSARE